MTSSPRMSGPQFTRRLPLDYQVTGGNARVLSQAATEAENSKQLMWSAFPEKAINNSVKDFRKRQRLQAGVSAEGGHFEDTM